MCGLTQFFLSITNTLLIYYLVFSNEDHKRRIRMLTKAVTELRGEEPIKEDEKESRSWFYIWS